MKVAGFIANRIAFNRQKSFSRFIIRLSIIATAISVAVMIVTLAMANGFQETVSRKIFSFWGHIRVQEKQPDKSIITEETPILKNDSLAGLVGRHPAVRHIYPFATKYAILKTKDEIEGVLLKGFDSSYRYQHLGDFIREGRFLQFNDSTYSREILVSSYTAERLQLKVNDRVLIYFIRADGRIRPDRLTISGIYKTGIEEYDKTFALGDLRLIQQLRRDEYNEDTWDREIGGYEVFIDDYRDIDRVADELYNMEAFPLTWDAVSVRQISPNIFDWLNMQDMTRNVLIGFMIVVALINLVTCLIILVLERIRMIGILKSLGATDAMIQSVFLRHSAIITLTGIITGTLFALGLCWLQQATGFIRLREEAYYVSAAAVKIAWWEVGIIGAGTLVICFLVMLIPSLLVRKIQPVKAIQFR